MKKVIITGFWILILLSLAIAYNCQDETDIDRIPCYIITPVITCGDYNYNVTKSSSGTLAQEGNLTASSDGTYYFSFDQGRGDYTIYLCENSSKYGFITVGSFDTNYEYYIYLIVFICWILLIVGFYLGDYTFTAIGGILSLVIGVYILINGLDGYANLVTEGFSIIHICLGAYVMIRGGYEIYKTM